MIWNTFFAKSKPTMLISFIDVLLAGFKHTRTLAHLMQSGGVHSTGPGFLLALTPDLEIGPVLLTRARESGKLVQPLTRRPDLRLYRPENGPVIAMG